MDRAETIVRRFAVASLLTATAPLEAGLMLAGFTVSRALRVTGVLLSG